MIFFYASTSTISQQVLLEIYGDQCKEFAFKSGLNFTTKKVSINLRILKVFQAIELFYVEFSRNDAVSNSLLLGH